MSGDLKDVWVMRNPTGHVHVITEMDPTGGDPLAFGWTVTRETLLTPEQAAVIAAAKAAESTLTDMAHAERDTMRAVCEAAKQWLEMRHGPRDVLYGNAQRALVDAVTALVAAEART